MTVATLRRWLRERLDHVATRPEMVEVTYLNYLEVLRWTYWMAGDPPRIESSWQYFFLARHQLTGSGMACTRLTLPQLVETLRAFRAAEELKNDSP